MVNLYEVNGLVTWSEEEIRIRQMIADYVKSNLESHLLKQNSAFRLFQCEAPVLIPRTLVNENYTDEDIFTTQFQHLTGGCKSEDEGDLVLEGPSLVLRPETTAGSYLYAKHLLNPHNEQKIKLPIVVWQHGKSFRLEQDQATKFMRLKEFHQLEFQILYGVTTANDYYPGITKTVCNSLSKLLGTCIIKPSDRLPDYSSETQDVVRSVSDTEMEVCSISRRNDFEGAKCIEVAIGTDRCVHWFTKD